MKLDKTLWLAVAFAALHLILALFYSAETPYRTGGVLRSYGRTPTSDIGAPDERQHANYVQTLLEGHLPVFRPNTAETGEHYEDHQPPLYYALTAAWAKLTGVSDVAQPEGVRLRWLNCLIGACTVVGVYFLVVWGYERKDVALSAAAITALLPMNCALSGAISNDPLLFLLCTWTLALCARSLRQGWTIRSAATIGVLCGAAIMTKTTGIALLPTLLYVCLAKQLERPTFRQVLAAGIPLLVIVLPWLLRNQSLYGDPLAMGAFKQAFVNSATPATVFVPDALKSDESLNTRANDLLTHNPELREPGHERQQIEFLDRELKLHSQTQAGYWTGWVAWWTTRSFFGAFGYMDIWLNGSGSPYAGDPNSLYRVLLALTVVGAIAWLANWKKPEWAAAKPVQWMLLLFAGLIGLSFISFNMQYFQGQGRYLYPAIGSISAALAIGFFSLLKQRQALLAAGFCALLLATNIYALSILGGEFAKRM